MGQSLNSKNLGTKIKIFKIPGAKMNFLIFETILQLIKSLWGQGAIMQKLRGQIAIMQKSMAKMQYIIFMHPFKMLLHYFNIFDTCNCHITN